MKNFFKYQENTKSLRQPRHPVLCAMDLFGLAALCILCVMYRPNALMLVLLLTMGGVYLASTMYHWFRYKELLHKLDHQMIVLLIGFTFVPYWLTYGVPMWRLSALLSLTLVLAVVRWHWFEREKLGAVLYLAVAAFPISTSLQESFGWMPLHAAIEFWVGISCYGLNFVVHHLKQPDPVPGLFGWRETQHIFVLLSITLQAHVLLEYCKAVALR